MNRLYWGYKCTAAATTSTYFEGVDYARKVTGVDKIHAIIGGFYLPADGGIFEEAIDSTLKELQKIDPECIVPCHCTGWKATNRIIDLMPNKFTQSAVCTTFTF